MKLFAKIACSLPHETRIVEAGAMAELLYIRGILFSKERLTDGKIHARLLPVIAVGIPGDCIEHASALVGVGLWEKTQDGYCIPLEKWQEWNTTRDEVERSRESARDRQARRRDKVEPCHAPVTHVSQRDNPVTASHPVTHLSQESSPTRVRVQSTEPETDNTTDTDTLPSDDGRAKADLPKSEIFDELQAAWNQLPEGLAPRISKFRSESHCTAWRKAQGKPELLAALSDVPRLMDAIRGSPALDRRRDPSATWFEFSWLFEKHTPSGEWKAVRILSGVYKREPFNARQKQLLEPGDGQRSFAADDRPRGGRIIRGRRPGDDEPDDRGEAFGDAD